MGQRGKWNPAERAEILEDTYMILKRSFCWPPPELVVVTRWETATAQWSINGTTAMVVVGQEQICSVGWGQFLLHDAALDAAIALDRVKRIHTAGPDPLWAESAFVREARIRRVAPFGGLCSGDSIFLLNRLDRYQKLWGAALAAALREKPSPPSRQLGDFTAPSSGGNNLQFLQPLDDEVSDDDQTRRRR
jgi:hypothetical protein